MEKWKTLHHLESPLEGDSAQSDFIKRLFQKSHIKKLAVSASSASGSIRSKIFRKRSVCFAEIRLEIKKIGYPIKRASYTKSLLSRLRAGRSGEAIGTRGGFSPRPDVIAGARCSSPFGPFQRAAPLRAYALATFRSNPPHRSASLHFAHCLRRITGRLLPAILLRQRTPFGNPCKLSLTHGNIAIANYHG